MKMIIPWLLLILFTIAQAFYSSSQAEAYTLTPLSRGIRVHRSRTILSESRRPVQSQYNNENVRDEEMHWEKLSGGSKEERGLKDLPFPQAVGEDFEQGNIARYGYDEEDDFGDFDEEYPIDEYLDEYSDDYSGEVADPGNFWSNPTGRMDRPVVSRRRAQGSQGQPRRRGYAAAGPRKTPGRRSPVRMNQNTVPRAAKDFYERLFWYGFDADETEGVGDKTVFGGTKGKFNGLSYKEASETSPYEGSNRSPRRYEGYYEEDIDVDADEEEYIIESQGRLRSMKPPTDAPYPRRGSSSGERRSRRARRPEPSEFNDRFDAENPSDWVSKSVSSWFTGDEGDIDDDDVYDDRYRRRIRRKQSSEWSPFNIVDTFFGVNRDEMQYKADLYNEKMGLGKRRRRSPLDGSRERPNQQTPRRAGYAYKYEDEDVDELNPIFDIDMVTLAEDTGKVADKRNTEAGFASKPGRKRKEKSWEERSLAVERVPPAGIPAWGPSGEIPWDARTKAIMDALEDIESARQELARKEKKETLAEEEITILKVDAELQRRKLRNSGSDPFLIQEQLRQIEFEMDDASMQLRRARTSTKLAREQLERLEERHWALLRFYDPDKAVQQVEAALLELGEGEPAARIPDSSVAAESAKGSDTSNSALT